MHPATAPLLPSKTPFSDALARCRSAGEVEAVNPEATVRIAGQYRQDPAAAQAVARQVLRAFNSRQGKPIPFPGHAAPLII